MLFLWNKLLLYCAIQTAVAFAAAAFAAWGPKFITLGLVINQQNEQVEDSTAVLNRCASLFSRHPVFFISMNSFFLQGISDLWSDHGSYRIDRVRHRIFPWSEVARQVPDGRSGHLWLWRLGQHPSPLRNDATRPRLGSAHLRHFLLRPMVRQSQLGRYYRHDDGTIILKNK